MEPWTSTQRERFEHQLQLVTMTSDAEESVDLQHELERALDEGRSGREMILIRPQHKDEMLGLQRKLMQQMDAKERFPNSRHERLQLVFHGCYLEVFLSRRGFHLLHQLALSSPKRVGTVHVFTAVLMDR